MSAHVLLYLLNELRKRNKMQGLLSILSLFHNKLNIFNNTGARMLDSIYHMKLKLIKNHIYGVKTSRFCHLLRSVIMDVITFPENLQTTICLSILLHSFISLPDKTPCDKIFFMFNSTEHDNFPSYKC